MSTDLMTGTLRKQNAAFLIATFFASLLMIVVALFLGDSAKQLLLAIGGGALGACIGAYFGNLIDASTVQQMRGLLDRTLNTPLKAGEDELEPFRRVWHSYHVTYANGKRIWRYRRYDFSAMDTSDKLFATFEVDGLSGERLAYNIEGFVLAPRLLLVQHLKGGSENPVLRVFPDGAMAFKALHAGMVFLQTFDTDERVVPALLSKNNLLANDPAGTAEGTVPPERAGELDRLWQANITKATTLQDLGMVSDAAPLPQSDAWKQRMFIDHAADFLEVMESRKTTVASETQFLLQVISLKPEMVSQLDIGCGAGDLPLQTSQVFRSVTALDSSPAFVCLSEGKLAKSPNASIILGDMREVAALVQGRQFDLITRVYTSLGYFPYEVELAVLRNLRRVSSSSCTLVIDTFNGAWLQSQPNSVVERSRQLATRMFSERYELTPAAMRGTWTFKGGTRGPVQIDFELERYDVSRAIDLLQKAGWSNCRAFAGFDVSKPAAHNSQDERIVLVASPS